MALNQKILLASPLSVLARLATIWQESAFFASIWFSFIRIVGGFSLALCLGVLLAILAGKFPILETFFLAHIQRQLNLCRLHQFIIISLIWLTSSELSIFISFLMVLPIIYTNVLEGIRSTDRKMTEMADVFHIPWNRRLVYIWAAANPAISHFRVHMSLGLSWRQGIAAEIWLPDGSIGEMLYNAKAYLNTVDLFAWTVIIVVSALL